MRFHHAHNCRWVSRVKCSCAHAHSDVRQDRGRSCVGSRCDGTTPGIRSAPGPGDPTLLFFLLLFSFLFFPATIGSQEERYRPNCKFIISWCIAFLVNSDHNQSRSVFRKRVPRNYLSCPVNRHAAPPRVVSYPRAALVRFHSARSSSTRFPVLFLWVDSINSNRIFPRSTFVGSY